MITGHYLESNKSLAVFFHAFKSLERLPKLATSYLSKAKRDTASS
jgi:hypothetical protein